MSDESAAGFDPRAAHADLTDLANLSMPFGKYAGRALINLPEEYLLWFAKQGFPRGRLGQLLAICLEIKRNGLEDLVRPLRGKTVPE